MDASFLILGEGGLKEIFEKYKKPDGERATEVNWKLTLNTDADVISPGTPTVPSPLLASEITVSGNTVVSLTGTGTTRILVLGTATATLRLADITISRAGVSVVKVEPVLIITSIVSRFLDPKVIQPNLRPAVYFATGDSRELPVELLGCQRQAISANVYALLGQTDDRSDDLIRKAGRMREVVEEIVKELERLPPVPFGDDDVFIEKVSLREVRSTGGMFTEFEHLLFVIEFICQY